MDSKLIYIANEKMKGKLSWYKVTDSSEWIYFGAGNEVNIDIVKQNIDKYFSDSLLYVSWTRQNSFQTTRENLLEKIKQILGLQNFVIWNSSFTQAIEFNNIGVLRCGKVCS